MNPEAIPVRVFDSIFLSSSDFILLSEMAAYAALVSLSHILHQILHPPPLNKIIIDKQQIEFLQSKVDFLIDFLEKYSSRRNQEIADLEPQIADAAYAAEDIIESNVVDQIRTYEEKSNPLYQQWCVFSTKEENPMSCCRFVRFLFCTEEEEIESNEEEIRTVLSEGVQPVVEKFLSIEKVLLKIKVNADLQPKNPTTTTISSRPVAAGGKMTMVGFEEHMTQIRDALTNDERTRQVIPITGMGGIGKTTLASAIYNHPFVVEHFSVRAWVSVSQEYNVEDLLSRLLSEITKEMSDDAIGQQLYQELYGRRYLIVMDDMWDMEVWDKVKMVLPVNDNGSRVLVTTRLSNLADGFGSCSPYAVGLLDEEKSWDLLRENVFDKEDCPGELEEIGKSIAKKCGGLPLAIAVIGGLLAKSEKMREHWESIEGDVTSTINYGNDDKFMQILSLSYSGLPIYLKPCFMYMAAFPEDAEIPRTNLVWLWVAEGLIKQTQAKCLEEVASDYLEDLTGRNLLLVSRRGRCGNILRIKIHDLLRDLCISEATKGNFLYITSLDDPEISPNIETKRRICVPSPNASASTIEALQLARLTRSWISTSHWIDFEESRILRACRLLRVAYVDGIRAHYYPNILQFTNLRYVLARSIYHFPSSMSQYWNLQTLDLYRDFCVPSEIWQMPQIRHLRSDSSICLPDPCGKNMIILENLQTLGVIENFTFTEEVAKRIPNLKKLKICYLSESSATSGKYCLKNLVRFKKLKSLGLQGNKELWTDICLPISLKKLILKYCKILWEDMSVVGKLPNLEVLKLMDDATSGEEWIPIEGEFRRLKFLMINADQLKIWGADNYHFPSLECLALPSVTALEEIPMAFAEILPLQVIELDLVDSVLWSSAKAVSDERELLGYEPLQVLEYDWVSKDFL